MSPSFIEVYLVSDNRKKAPTYFQEKKSPNCEPALLKLDRIFAYTKYTPRNVFEMVKYIQNLRF